MKLTITPSELAKLFTQEELCEKISRCLNLTVHRVEVDEFNNTLAGLCQSAINNFPRYETDQKIAAIKALRGVISALGHQLGLGNAKYAVEHWDKWIQFVRDNNRLPKGDYLYDGILE